MPRLLVIVVSYNSEEVLAGCLGSLRAAIARDAVDAHVVVSDSASQDASREIAAVHGAEVLPGPNTGFGAANNRAIRHAGDGVDYVLLANPDTRIAAGSLADLLATADAHPEAGAFAAAQVDQHGNRHQTLRREQRWWHSFTHGLPWDRVSIAHRDEAFYAREQVVDWAEGSFLLLRKSVLDEVGLFDEQFPLYSEEKDLCRRIRNAGHTIRYVPSLVVEHSVSGREYNERLYLLLLQSHVQYARKWEGAISALLVRLAIVLRWGPRGYLPRRDFGARDRARAIVRMAVGRAPARLPE